MRRLCGGHTISHHSALIARGAAGWEEEEEEGEGEGGEGIGPPAVGPDMNALRGIRFGLSAKS